MVYVYNVYLNHDKVRSNPVSHYQSYLDEQRRRRHRQAYAVPLYRQRSIEREMERQKQQEHLREIKRDDRELNKSIKDVIGLKDRLSSRYPQYRYNS